MFLVYSFDGLLIFSLLVICTCAYLKRIPRLKQWMFSEKKGFLGIFYKGMKYKQFFCSKANVVRFFYLKLKT